MTDNRGPEPVAHRRTGTAEHPALVRWMERLESAGTLDRWHKPFYAAARSLVGEPRRAAALRGEWLGHAVHPLLTDVPIGAWTASMLLDLCGGGRCRTASRRFVALGVVAAVPTAMTGIAEWAGTSGRERRVGFVHAVGNTAAIGLYTASWVARRRGGDVRGILWGVAGGAAASVAGYLGGHLTSARKVSSRHPVFDHPSGT